MASGKGETAVAAAASHRASSSIMTESQRASCVVKICGLFLWTKGGSYCNFWVISISNLGTKYHS